MSRATLEEAYERFDGTGPEWGGNLSNHGPMAVEVLARRGFDGAVPAWVDRYLPRLDGLPAKHEAIGAGTWAAALGDFGRVTDWTDYFSRQVAEHPWREVLATWWPRLLPGIAAGATHGLIRTAHAVRTLLSGDESGPVTAELARGLAFWATRATAIPGTADPAGMLAARDALAALPRLADRSGPIAGRLSRLSVLDGWSRGLSALRPPARPTEVPERLAELVDAATFRYLTHGYASPVLLVHTATAPNAVLHALPALPEDVWLASLSAVWAASAAITTAYGPAEGTPPEQRTSAPHDTDPAGEVLDRAVRHGDEHVIKFTDTAVEVYTRTGNPDALGAAVTVGRLIDAPG